MLNRFRSLLSSGDERSRKAKKNIVLSFANKVVAIVISLLIVPVTIDYLDAEQYGIWLTLSSIVAWISFFDIGLGHGFRNRFAEAKARGDHELARRYVSTTYLAMLLIFGVALVLFECVNPFISWAALLNISPSYGPLLSVVVSIILIGVCTQFAMNVLPIMLSADQRPAATAMIATAGQAFALLVIYLLTLQPHHSMAYIAVALTWVPVLVTIVVSLWLFTHSYRRYAPSWRCIDLHLIGNIVNLGGKFFVIQISMILIFQVVNVILSRVLGPAAVTEYNVSYKYFSITQMVFNIILSPYWSAFTDVYTKGELQWMAGVHRQLTKVFLLLVALSLLMLALSPWAFRLWLGDSISVPFTTSVAMALYINVMSYSMMYMILLNGTGKVLMQMLVYIICACISLPLSCYVCGLWGIPGVLAVLSAVYAAQAVVARVQL